MTDDKKRLEEIRKSNDQDVSIDRIEVKDFLLAQIGKLEQKLSERDEALRFYATMQDWGYDHGSDSECDFGAKAREALGEE